MKPKGNLSCAECGATQARNGNPFTALTLRVHQGRMHGIKKLKGEKLPYGLTHRQIEVLDLIVTGLPELDVAERMSLGYHTVHAHVRNIYQKLAVRNRAEAVGKWLQAKSPSQTPPKRATRADPPATGLQFCPTCGCSLTGGDRCDETVAASEYSQLMAARFHDKSADPSHG